MRSKRLFTISIMFISSFIFTNLSYGQTYWNKVVGSGMSCVDAIQSAGNGNFLIVGYTDDYKGLILKIKPNGDTIFSKTYGKGSYNSFSAIQGTSDGNFLIAGCTDADGWILKIDQKGDTLCAKTYSNSKIYSIQTSNDSNFLVAGSKDSGDIATNGFVMKIKPDGSTIWLKTYYNKSFNDFRSIHSCGDGNFLLAGITRSASDTGAFYGWLVKIKPNGDTIWSKVYQKGSDSFIYSVQSSGDGNFLLAGWTRQLLNSSEYDGWIVKIKPDGDTIWTKTYNQYSDDKFSSIQLTNDNNFILTGNTRSGDTVSGLLVKIRPNGDVIWSKTIGKSKISDFKTIKTTSDGNFLVSGFGGISILCIIADQYAKSGQMFTYEIPVYGGDPSHFVFTPLKTPSGMTVSTGDTISWPPSKDSVYIEHAEFVVVNNIGSKDTLTFNIFVNNDYKTQNVSKPIQSSNPIKMPFDIAVTSIPGYVKFNLPPNTGTLFIYDITGRMVDKITPSRSASGTCINWPGNQTNHSSIHAGKYLIKANTGSESITKLFALMK